MDPYLWSQRVSIPPPERLSLPGGHPAAGLGELDGQEKGHGTQVVGGTRGHLGPEGQSYPQSEWGAERLVQLYGREKNLRKALHRESKGVHRREEECVGDLRPIKAHDID